MNKDYLEILKNVELFNSLPPKQRKELFSAFFVFKLAENQILFHQGESSDGLYVVLSGSLAAILEKGGNVIEMIGRIKEGDVVGEVGLLTNSARIFTVKSETQATLLKLSKPDFDNFINAHPKTIHQILLRGVVKRVELFRNLDNASLDKLASAFSPVDLDEGEILFHQGEPSDSIYVVLSGYLLAILEKADGHTEIIGKISSNELIGEMGALTNKPRALTVKSLTKVKLLKISRLDFIDFVNSSPTMLYPILVSAIERTQSAVDIISQRKIHSHVAVIPANYQVDVNGFIQELKSFSQAYQDEVFFLTSDEINQIYLKEDLDGVIKHFEKLEKDYDFIVYALTANCVHDVVKILLQKSNKIMIVGIGDTRRYFSDFSAQILENQELANIEKALVLLWSNPSEVDRTGFWLKQGDFKLHFHVFKEDANSYQRILRFVRLKLIGLVFGGGGFRAWFHLGVIKAIEEKKIPIDIVGGTSAGAGIGACYLEFGGGEHLIEAARKFSESLISSISWKSFTFPIVSFYSASPATKTVQKIFSQHRIENFPIPYFAVSCNISHDAEVVHRRGSVWEALRSSCAIPFLFPPFVKNGQLLYDGGLVNNLPIDQMRDLVGPKGIVIASDLGMTAEDKKLYDFPPILSPGNVLMSKMPFRKKHYIFPDFFETAIRATLMGAVPRYRENIQLANYYIHADFSGYKLIFVERELWEKLVQYGYEHALVILKDWKYS